MKKLLIGMILFGMSGIIASYLPNSSTGSVTWCIEFISGFAGLVLMAWGGLPMASSALEKHA